jgi:cell shape-determining protein MreC
LHAQRQGELIWRRKRRDEDNGEGVLADLCVFVCLCSFLLLVSVFLSCSFSLFFHFFSRFVSSCVYVFYSLCGSFIFFFDNHREYIKKAIKPIAKEKYKGYEKKKPKKLIYYSKQQKDYLRFLITPQFDAIRRS